MDTTRQGTERVAESIRANVEKIRVTGWTDIHGAVTASLGCASIHDTHTLESALKDADESLYQAKQNGRNQVSFAD